MRVHKEIVRVYDINFRPIDYEWRVYEGGVAELFALFSRSKEPVVTVRKESFGIYAAYEPDDIGSLALAKAKEQLVSFVTSTRFWG